MARALRELHFVAAHGQGSAVRETNARLHTAAGSAGETLVGLQVVARWRFLPEKETAAADALCRRVIAILWRMTH